MSRLKYDYSGEKHLVATLGGPAVLEAVKAQVEGVDIPACPFCGGEAVVELGMMFTLSCVSIECSHCHNRTMRVATGVDVLTQKSVSIHDAVANAIRRWSRRKESAA